MTPLLITVLLMQVAPTTSPARAAPMAASSPAAVVAPVEPAPSTEDTYQGLQQVYSTTCGQTGILYHSYDEICESLRKQIKSYREKIDREQALAAHNAPKR